MFSTTLLVTRVQVGDYDAWKPMFDLDGPGARAKATGHRIFRHVDDPADVVIAVEYATPQDAAEARDTLLASGVLERVELADGPSLVEVAEAVAY